MRSILAAGLAFLLAGACSAPLYQGDMFFVHTDGADLPVWVRGDIGSGTVVVVLHGGPGDWALALAALPALQDLETRYAVAYWDQRLSGNNYGNAPESTLSFETMTQDVKAVTDVIQSQYRFARVFLMGLSWGGGLGTLALKDSAFQAKIAGWIEVDGAHAGVKTNQLSRQWAIDFANSYLAETSDGADAAYWRDALAWYSANPVLTSANIGQHGRYLSKAGGLGNYVSVLGDYAADILLASPVGLGFLQNNYVYDHTNTPGFDLQSSDFSPGMETITLPSLMLWGADDGRVPAAMADDALGKLGTPTADKSKVIFAGSQHCTMIFDKNSGAFAASVTEFIEKYR